MKKQKTLQLNSVLNISRTFVSLVFPLISYPYVLRILGVSNIGKNNTAASIVSYFTLLAGLGIVRYASREGARKRENAEEFSLFASQMFTLNMISAAISFLLMAVVVSAVDSFHAYATLIMINSVSILGTTMGMDWINSACEEYVYITIRTAGFQVISLILLFIMVRNEGDINNYAWVTVIANIGANVLNFFYIRRIARIKIVFRGIKKHLAPIMWLFASTIATTIYVNSDTTMLGLICGDRYVGLYSVSTKIYLVLQQLLAAAILVTLPRLSNLIAKGELEEFKSTVEGAFEASVALLFPVVTGLFCMAEEAILIIGGEVYLDGVNSLRILSISLIFSACGIFYTNTMLLPIKKERLLTIIMIIAAAANLGLNFVFIPWLKQNGAAITTVIAEFIVMTGQMVVAKREKLFLPQWKPIGQALIGCAGIVCVCLIAKTVLDNFWIRTVVSVAGSAVVYALILLALRNRVACRALKKCFFCMRGRK